jgi:hypothetical protein
VLSRLWLPLALHRKCPNFLQHAVGEYFIKGRRKTRSEITAQRQEHEKTKRLTRGLAYTGATSAMSVQEVCQDTIDCDYPTLTLGADKAVSSAGRRTAWSKPLTFRSFQRCPATSTTELSKPFLQFPLYCSLHWVTPVHVLGGDLICTIYIWDAESTWRSVSCTPVGGRGAKKPTRGFKVCTQIW